MDRGGECVRWTEVGSVLGGQRWGSVLGGQRWGSVLGRQRWGVC